MSASSPDQSDFACRSRISVRSVIRSPIEVLPAYWRRCILDFLSDRSATSPSQRRTGIAFDVGHGDVGDAGDAVWQIPDQPPGQSTRQGRDHDTVEVLLVEQLPGSVDRQGVDDLSAGLDPGPPQPGELMLQPAFG